ncbi:MAG: activator of alkane oxidation [Caulobacteraceae bacterium]|nr:activator of alkane oxidation [Caulobacteraceae bacterium]
MKILATLGATALLALGLTTQASAVSLSPTSTTFSATGSTSLTKLGITIGCTASFTGNIDGAGVGHIATASFSPGSALCSGIGTTGLPWTATALTSTGSGAGTGSIAGVAVTTALGNCGPSTLPVTMNTTGVLSFSGASLSGGCTVTGSIQTTANTVPPTVVSIVP